MPTIDMAATGLKIKEILEIKGITVKEAAKKFGFTSPYPVYKWINGKTLPALDNLVILAKVTGTKLDDLIVVDEAA